MIEMRLEGRRKRVRETRGTQFPGPRSRPLEQEELGAQSPRGALPLPGFASPLAHTLCLPGPASAKLLFNCISRLTYPGRLHHLNLNYSPSKCLPEKFV